MPQSRRAFRIEQVSRPGEQRLRPEPPRAVPPADSAAGGDGAANFRQLLNEIRTVRSLIEGPGQEAKRAIARFQAHLNDFQKLKSELDMIESAIADTKQELATIHITGFQGPEMARVADELDAVVEGTEQATESILNAVEEIDQRAATLAGTLEGAHEQRLAQDIQDGVVRIFEACNFQDLTGQRITKVVSTLKFIEQHIARMMEIWGGIDAFAQYTPEAMAEREGDEKLLNGPKLEGESGHASQDDIDALFG
jgi:chemotaxis protein CheZ